MERVRIFLIVILSGIFLFVLLPRIFFFVLGSGWFSRDFAEFSINDVSKEMYFIDSTSASPNISHANISVIITGEIDSSAIVTYASTNPENHGSGSYELKKGVINIKTQYDYYAGDTI